MTHDTPTRPVLFCYDGSDGSRVALRSVIDLIERPVHAVVLSVWERIAVRLALSGAFAIGSVPSEGEMDEQEESYARAAAEEGARRAGERGYDASPMTKEATEGIPRAILDVADEVSARLIVCGQRGRGRLRTTLLGSVSHTLASHTRHPVLIAPQTTT